MDRGLSTHLFVQQRLTIALLDRIWHAGIPLVEFFLARQHLDYRNLAQVQEIGHWFRDSRLRLNSIHLPMFSDDCWGRTGPNSVVNIVASERYHRRQSVDELKRALEVAEYVPCRFAILHLGVGGEEFDDAKMDWGFSALEELNLFARQRGVEVLLENTPNQLSSAERLFYFLGITHLTNGVCFDTGHAHMLGRLEAEFGAMRSRVRSTHVHDNDGKADLHLFPGAPGGAIPWAGFMPEFGTPSAAYPLMLELREVSEMADPLGEVNRVFDRLEEFATRRVEE